MKRRLAAIMAADVVGYSRLMGVDEIGTLERLKSLRKELVQPRIAEHGGRVVKLMGDGLLAEFESAVDAVECGRLIQEGVAEREVDAPEEARIRLRIGVNLGDVIHEGSDVYGDGVNVAARLEAIAEPGGMCVSTAVRDLVESRAAVTFEDAGEQQLKNIDRPVRVWRWRTGAAPPPAPAARDGRPRPAIAVLPFDNMSADPDQEYFSDGLAEDIITALTYWRHFPVIARNSSFAYKGRAIELRQVGRDLGARYVLEGSVRRAADRIRVTAQLIDCASGHHVWAERYDRALDDVFAVQDDIVERIAAVVAPEVAKAEGDRTRDKTATDLDAWDLCLRAMPHLRLRTAEGNARARELFERATEIQPDYSDAHAGLAQSYQQDILISDGRNREETAALAMAAARRAVECDEASSWAHHELSTAYQWLDRIDDALAEARIAVELNPYDAYALHALGNKSDLAGDPEGVARMERAQKLNPEDARRHTHLVFLARAHVNRGEHAEAAELARRSIRREPGYAPAHYVLALALAGLGRIEEGRAALARCDALSPDFVAARRDWRPYRDAEANARLRDLLRRLEEGTGADG